MTARMQKSGGTGQGRAERGKGLLEEKCCPQTAAAESGVRSPVQEEELLYRLMAGIFLLHVASVLKATVEI